MLTSLQRATPMWLLCAAGLLLGALNLGLGDPRLRSLLMGGAALAAWLLAALGAFARSRAEPARAAAWKALAAGFLVTSLFTTVGFVRILLGHHAAPAPAPAVFITWAALACLGLAWLRFQPGPIRGLRWLELALDGGNFLASLLLAYWLVFLRDAFQAAPFPLVDRVATLGLLFGIAGLAGVFGRAASWSGGGFRGPLGCISLALLVMALNLPFLETFLARQPFIGHPAQTGMIPAWLLMIAASRRPLPGAIQTREAAGVPLRDLLSYAPLAIAIPALLYSTLARRVPLDPFTLALLGIVLASLGARQVLALAQLRALNRTLEDRVEARTRALAEAQSTLVRTERMNLVATLGAGAVHDINNLLSSALLSTDLALEAGDDPPHREALERIRASIDKAGALTRRLLDFGQAPAGREAFAPVERIRNLLPVLRGMVPRRIELGFEPGTGSCLLEGDPQAFDQVLVNLVSNARDAIPGHGTILLRCQGGEHGFQLEVVDTGLGVPEAVQARLFEPFFTTKATGTGLGLSSTRAIVDGFGGRIELDSAPGLGASFRLRFPGQGGND